MLDLTAASALVEREANLSFGRSRDNRLRVLREAIVEKHWGWIIYYGDGYADVDADPENPSYPPYLVNRQTGEILGTGHAWPVAKYVEDYETRLRARD